MAGLLANPEPLG